jgi:hypothetical protein
MKDDTGGVHDERDQPSIPKTQRSGADASARDRSLIDRMSGTESVREGSATNASAFAPWHQAARLRELPARMEAGPFVDTSRPRHTVSARAMADNAFVELIISCFKSFRDVGGFQRALASIPEAGSIRVRHVHQGKMQVSVQCRSVGTLLRSLASAYERPFTVIAREPHRVELALLDGVLQVAGQA